MSHSYKDFFKAAKRAKSSESKIKKKYSGKVEVSKSATKHALKYSKMGKFPFGTFVFVIIGFVVASLGLYNIDEVDSLISKVKINFVGLSMAAEESKEKKSTKKDGQPEESSTKTKEHSQEKAKKGESWSEEDVKHFSKLNHRKKQLDQREAELNELEKELHDQKNEIEARIRKLEEIRLQIGHVLKEKVEVDQERVNKLVDFYSNMKPQQAAKIIATINEDLAVEILGKMKKKNAASILNLLKSKKAKVLSEKFAGYKRR